MTVLKKHTSILKKGFIKIFRKVKGIGQGLKLFHYRNLFLQGIQKVFLCDKSNK